MTYTNIYNNLDTVEDRELLRVMHNAKVRHQSAVSGYETYIKNKNSKGCAIESHYNKMNRFETIFEVCYAECVRRGLDKRDRQMARVKDGYEQTCLRRAYLCETYDNRF
ncbi:MAG: hypothetical protein IKB70_08380 [Bacilli bacterium]|nr:hypothetical protein [Bacilli bacterium]